METREFVSEYVGLKLPLNLNKSKLKNYYFQQNEIKPIGLWVNSFRAFAVEHFPRYDYYRVKLLC